MSIIQHLVIDQYGAFLGKNSERLIVTKAKEKIAPPAIRLRILKDSPTTTIGVNIDGCTTHDPSSR
jgi:hypothetical protein